MTGKDVVTTQGTFDPRKVFQALADIIGDRNGLEIKVVSVSKKGDKGEKEKAG